MYDLDDLARFVRIYGLVLAYGGQGATLAFRYRLPADLRRAIRNHRRGLARMMAAGRVELCPSPDAHRREWTYQGSGRYICPLCRQIDQHQLGLWPLAG